MRATLSTVAAGRPGARMCAVYDERLGVPLRWWALATMFVASMLLAFLVATPLWVARGRHRGRSLACARPLRRVRRGAGLGRATGCCPPDGPGSPWTTSATVQALDAEATRRLAGRDADARAYLLLRPYLRGGPGRHRGPGRPDAVLAGQHRAGRTGWRPR